MIGQEVCAHGILSDGEACLAQIERWVPDALCRRWVVISDARVAALWSSVVVEALRPWVTVTVLAMPAGESYKTRETKAQLEDQLLGYGFDRHTLVLALGGGVVLDMAGFLAATYLRGVPVCYLPTSWLAMVDACIGGKTAVNTVLVKNAIGCVVQPRGVLADVQVLSTLPPMEWSMGCVEAMKHALLTTDAKVHQRWLLSSAHWMAPSDVCAWEDEVRRQWAIKSDWVRGDEQDTGQRQVLNLGHTLAHALEVQTRYTLPHGMAVAVGLMFALRLSEHFVGLSSFWRMRVTETLGQMPGLREAVQPILGLSWHEVSCFLKHDKKAHLGEPAWVLIQSPGCVGGAPWVRPLPEAPLQEAWDRLRLDPLWAGMVG